MNWSQMTPRERDALVAEKVLGWKYSTVDEYSWFNPTTNIADAWRVLEKFGVWQVTKLLSGEYRAIIAANKHKGYGRTAPEAIAKAALRAMGVDVQ
jgi:hypothetical protein